VREAIALSPDGANSLDEQSMADSHIVITGMSPALDGLQWESDKFLRIGRTPNMDIMLNDLSISRSHAEISLGPEGWAIADQGSSNGTYLNGIRIGRTLQKLRQHDLLRFGELFVSVKSLHEQAPDRPKHETAIRTSGRFLRLQAATQNPWQNAVTSLDEIAEQRPERDKGFLALLRAGHYLCQASALDDLLQSVLRETISALSAQRAAIILMDQASNQLKLRASISEPRCSSSARFFSKTLADRCYQEGQSLLCIDPMVDERLGIGSIQQGSMTSIICALMRTPRKRLGVLHLDRGSMQQPFTEDDFYLADAIAASVSTGVECAQLVEQQRAQNIQMVTALAQAVELRDQYTAGHTQRVTTYSMLLAREIDFAPADQQILQIGTPLHDLGKIGVRDSVLQKAGKLTPDEFEHIKLHTVKGAQILETMPDLINLIPILLSHHERWDGKGYPDGLAGSRISPLARIVAIADAFDAMTSNRPYRPALSVDQAFAELSARAGTHFDPYFADAFLRLRSRVEAIIAQEESQKVEGLSLAETYPVEHVRVAADELPGRRLTPPGSETR
jgi:HD-GYP domain-containing protein (c-di-GMP phosphodiesterase class II)